MVQMQIIPKKRQSQCADLQNQTISFYIFSAERKWGRFMTG